MSDERDWVMDVGAAHGSWELAESPSYDLRALKAEYDSTFRKAASQMVEGGVMPCDECEKIRKQYPGALCGECAKAVGTLYDVLREAVEAAGTAEVTIFVGMREL